MHQTIHKIPLSNELIEFTKLTKESIEERLFSVFPCRLTIMDTTPKKYDMKGITYPRCEYKIRDISDNNGYLHIAIYENKIFYNDGIGKSNWSSINIGKINACMNDTIRHIPRFKSTLCALSNRFY